MLRILVKNGELTLFVTVIPEGIHNGASTIQWISREFLYWISFSVRYPSNQRCYGYIQSNLLDGM